ncbi:MAG: hypothetical protein QNK36_00320 [Colwellia sp.]|nr:hypothetical protein [Colwellia sp.]
MTANLSSQIAHYGVSESFTVFIDSLRDTPGLSDKKFRLADVNKVAQYLVCRNYGKACLELSYLAWAVVNYPKKTLSNAPLLEFFWVDENITPARFRQAFEQPCQTENINIGLNKAGLALTFSSQSFIISPTRVGLLAVLLEIIVTLAPEQLTTIEQRLKGTDNEQAIKALSSDLQKQIYQFLGEHLIPAQQQRRFRYVSQWLDKSNADENKANENLASTHTLNDETVLSFWQYAVLDDTSPGYKLYASAFYGVMDTHQAIQQAKQSLALDNAGTIGFNTEAGEYSPDVIQDILFSHSSGNQDYSWLCQAPKFLTKAQWSFIEPITQNHPYSTTLALSFARLAVFGQWQAALVQAKRKSSVIVLQKLADLPQESYLQYQQRLVKLQQIMTQVIMAISYIFYSHQDSRYLGFSLAFLPQSDAQKIRDWFEQKMHALSQDSLTTDNDTTIGADTENINKVLFTQSQKLLMQSRELKQIIQASKIAFNANNKDGFQHLPSADLLDIYQEGYDGVAHCQHIVQSCIEKLSLCWLTSSDCEANYCSDISIFKDIFALLYGEVNDQ